jgi:hypothetical protein
MMKILKLPFHPILFSSFPIIYLFARNIVFIRLADTVRSFILFAGFAIFFLIGFRLITKNWEKAALICSLLIALFFYYGQLASALDGLFTQFGKITVNISVLGWIGLFLFLALTFLIVNAKRTNSVTVFLNVVGILLIGFQFIAIIVRIKSVQGTNSPSIKAQISRIRGDASAENGLSQTTPTEYPDIYYIILDSYERGDKLAQYYGYDNTPFIEALRDRKFYIASFSRSNFLSTTFSLNSALNMIYFNDFPKEIIRSARYNLQTNYVTDFLREYGYQIIVFDSGTGDSNNQYADLFLSPESTHQIKKTELNPFETLLIQTSGGLFFGGINHQAGSPDTVSEALVGLINQDLKVRRDRIQFSLTHLPDFVSQEGRHFIFVHIYLPHAPFLFGAGGEPLQYKTSPGMDWYVPDPDEYIAQYTDQINYLNQAILTPIDKILDETNRPVVIVLQSDHGDGKYLNWDVPTAQGVDIRSATLSAIYFSDHRYDSLYQSLTTVNTFRIVFNHWFGTQYPLLPDKVFFHKHPLSIFSIDNTQFVDSCDHFNLCLPSR